MARVGLFVEPAGSLDGKFATCEHGVVERIEKLPHGQPLFVWRLQCSAGGRASRITSVDQFRDNGKLFGQSDECIQVA